MLEVQNLYKNDNDFLLGSLMDISKHIENSEDPNKDLSSNQIRTLAHIYRCEAVKPGEIAERFNITPATVTSQMDKLVEGGWVQRKYDEKDRRAINISLTSKAQKELKDLLSNTLKDYDWILDALNKEERKIFLKMLLKIDEHCHTYSYGKCKKEK